MKELLENENNYYKDLCKQQEQELERLNNKIDKFVEDFEDYLFTNPLVSLDDYYRRLDYILMLEKDMPDTFMFIKTIKDMVKELKKRHLESKGE